MTLAQTYICTCKDHTYLLYICLHVKVHLNQSKEGREKYRSEHFPIHLLLFGHSSQGAQGGEAGDPDGGPAKFCLCLFLFFPYVFVSVILFFSVGLDVSCKRKKKSDGKIMRGSGWGFRGILELLLLLLLLYFCFTVNNWLVPSDYWWFSFLQQKTKSSHNGVKNKRTNNRIYIYMHLRKLIALLV